MVVIEEISSTSYHQHSASSSSSSASTAPSSSKNKHAWSLPDSRAGRINIVDEEAHSQSGSFTPVMSVADAERYVEELKNFDVEEVGSSRWIHQHEKLEKLNLQAHQSARSHSDEFVLEAFVTFDKMSCLIRDLLVVDCWRENVLPLLLDDLAARRATMRAYFVLFHEATVINLLEVLIYHLHGCEAAGDSLVELIDYCASKVALLNSGRLQKQMADYTKAREETIKNNSTSNIRGMAENIEKQDPAKELRHQAAQLQLQVSVTTVGILRFICGHIESLSLAVLNRLVQTHDIMLGIIPLIENPPWTRRREKDGKWEKMIDFKWQVVEPVNLMNITKNEGQAWLALYHLTCSGEIRQRYHFNSFRKGQLLRVRKYLNEVMLDQLPILADVQRFMDELAVADVPEPTAVPSALLLEQVAEIRESIMKGKDWSSAAKQQLKSAFSKSDAEDDDLKRLANVYSNEWVDEVVGGETKCGKCGKEASKKCSRCGIEWYCSRECQVAAWKAHKVICDVVASQKPRPDSS